MGCLRPLPPSFTPMHRRPSLPAPPRAGGRARHPPLPLPLSILSSGGCRPRARGGSSKGVAVAGSGALPSPPPPRFQWASGGGALFLDPARGGGLPPPRSDGGLPPPQFGGSAAREAGSSGGRWDVAAREAGSGGAWALPSLPLLCRAARREGHRGGARGWRHWRATAAVGELELTLGRSATGRGNVHCDVGFEAVAKTVSVNTFCPPQ
ncbi:hypothetical protein PVAP13_3KG125457 [Panicum virgatum]|uniref:Uncharacterized protein n=1 Tax=Panicum virgatum TaxID=38727 RepID=A0A8T0UZ33_PANVG|nr:hypothetical protein PVAP13_3KG125457 [Panicum virgatum]